MRTKSNYVINANKLILIMFVIFFISILSIWLPKDILSNGMAMWAYTDWLIDYSSGFTRRGLSGELISLLSTFVHPRAIIGFLSWFIFSAAVFGYIRLCIRSINTLSPILLLAMLFLPSLLPFYFYDHGAFGRKETFGFLILLWHLWLLEVNCNKEMVDISGENFFSAYAKRLLLITGILLPIHVFVHESSIFLFAPVHIIITYSVLRLNPSINFRQILFYLVLIYMPVIIAFLIVFTFGRPSYDVAQAICKKWELANALEVGEYDLIGKDRMWALPGSLTALSWTLSQACSLTLSISAVQFVAWFLVFAVLGFTTAYFSKSVSRSFANNSIGTIGKTKTTFTKHHSNIMCYKYYLIPIVISIPLYMMGWDFGRWFAVSCINYAMISLSREVNYMECCFAIRKRAGNSFFTKSQLPVNSFASDVNSRPHYFEWVFLLLIVFFIRLPHYCNSVINMLASPLRPMLRLLLHLLN